MQISITYTYAAELSRQIYIERGERCTHVTFTIREHDLAPEARTAALTALADKLDSRLLLDPSQLSSARPLARSTDLETLHIMHPGPQLREVDPARARADAEGHLFSAAQNVTSINTRHAQLQQAQLATRAIVLRAHRFRNTIARIERLAALAIVFYTVVWFIVLSARYNIPLSKLLC